MGINKLDSTCKIHDKYSGSDRRAIADEELAERAWERDKASYTSLGEKTVASAVNNIMKATNKFGGGSKKKRKNTSNTKLKKNSYKIRKKLANL